MTAVYMHKLKRLGILIAAAFILFSFPISSQMIDYDELLRMEEKWDIDAMGRRKSEPEFSPLNRISRIPPYLTPFQADVQEFQIHPGMDNTVKGRFGTEIFIPADSFTLPYIYRQSDLVIFSLTEILNDLDLLSSGLDLLQRTSDRPEFIESSGAISVSASYYRRILKLKKGARIRIRLPLYANHEKKMTVYKFIEGRGWVEKGNDEIIETEEKKFRLFSGADELTHWVFGTPEQNTFCIEGNIISENPPYSAVLIGSDFKTSHSIKEKKAEFRMQIPLQKKFRILIMDEFGNLGISREMSIQKEKPESGCRRAEEISVVTGSREIRKDRKKLLEYLGWKDIFQKETGE